MVRSTFRSQNVQNTSASDRFWKLRCRKSARRCGAKHILKSTCTKHTIVGPLFDVQTSKKCMPFWRGAHFEVKKTLGFRTTFGGSDSPTLHYMPLQLQLHNYTITFHYTPLHYNYNYNYTPLHSTTLHYTKLHYTTLHHTTVHYIPLHSTTLHCISLHYSKYTA